MFNNIKKIVILCGAIATIAFSTTGFSYELPTRNNFWHQNHVQSDGRGGFYDHKPGTPIWQDQHITSDNRGGFYIHTPGTSLWKDDHISSDGRGGFYY